MQNKITEILNNNETTNEEKGNNMDQLEQHMKKV